MMERLSRSLPILVVAAAVAITGFYLYRASPVDDERMNLDRFAELPVVQGGRPKPFGTLAQVSLRTISNRSYFEDASGTRQPAVQWLLDVICKPREARQHKVFRIVNTQLLDTLGLEERPGFRYALSEFTGQKNLQDLREQVRRASNKDQSQRDAYERAAMDLWRRMNLFRHIQIAHDIIRVVGSEGGQQRLQRLASQMERAAQMEIPFAVPPASHKRDDQWKPLSAAVIDSFRQAEGDRPSLDRPTRLLWSIFRAYNGGNASEFNQKVAGYHAWFDSHMSETLQRSRFESWYNALSPMFACMVLYVIAFIVGCLAWLGWFGPLSRGAFWLAAVTLAVHTVALLSRMYLMERPFVFVTNLYSSAVFIGWAGVLTGLVLERFFRNGLGTVVGAVIGFVTLVIAYNLGFGSDTLEVKTAVLDTNFWLATHVTTVTLGYSATYLAGVLGIVYVLTGVLTRALNKDLEKDLGRMIYGIICFALMLSFIGTVLGGIWADQSWGRFWGWDPKENGALIIVLWNALILHARWGGMVQHRGMATLAIFGNVVTSWSWFGVNMLGQGLHSYGFMEGATFWLVAFVLSQLALIAIGSLPKSMWMSFDAGGKPRKPSSQATPKTRPAT